MPVELLYSDEQLRELRAREERQLLEDGTRRRGRAMPRRDPSTGSAPGFFADAFTDRSGGDAPFTSGGDGVFDGGGAAGSFGGDGGDGGS